LGSTSGAISVWSMGNHLYQNVKQVVDAMKMSNDFWFNYPIFLNDYDQFNQTDFRGQEEPVYQG
jgi:ATP sulfurylase